MNRDSFQTEESCRLIRDPEGPPTAAAESPNPNPNPNPNPLQWREPEKKQTPPSVGDCQGDQEGKEYGLR